MPNNDYDVPLTPSMQVSDKKSFAKLVTSEAVGMFVFIYGAISAVNFYVLSSYGSAATLDAMAVAICFGLSLTAGIHLSSYSGGHLNPSVSFSVFVVDNDINLVELLAYWLGQGIGSILAGLLVVAQYASWINNYENHEDNLTFVGMYGTLKNPNVSLVSGVLDQFVGSFVLMYAICAIPGTKYKPFLVGAVLAALGTLMQSNGFAFNGWRDMGPRLASTTLFGGLPFTAADSWFWVPLVIPFPAMVCAKLAYNHKLFQ